MIRAGIAAYGCAHGGPALGELRWLTAARSSVLSHGARFEIPTTKSAAAIGNKKIMVRVGLTLLGVWLTLRSTRGGPLGTGCLSVHLQLWKECLKRKGLIYCKLVPRGGDDKSVGHRSVQLLAHQVRQELVAIKARGKDRVHGQHSEVLNV